MEYQADKSIGWASVVAATKRSIGLGRDRLTDLGRRTLSASDGDCIGLEDGIRDRPEVSDHCQRSPQPVGSRGLRRHILWIPLINTDGVIEPPRGHYFHYVDDHGISRLLGLAVIDIISAELID
jgi:hypothetical protein